MATIINATTSSGLIVSPDQSGILQLQSSGNTIATISSTGIQTNVGAPAFSAYSTVGQQSVTSNVYTKVVLNTKRFDTANCFDNTTNYRFTPNVAGYYQINAKVGGLANSGTLNRANAVIYKNGGGDSWVGSGPYSFSSTTLTMFESFVSATVYLNGTTDYVELYAVVQGTSPLVDNGGSWTYFDGHFVRSA